MHIFVLILVVFAIGATGALGMAVVTWHVRVGERTRRDFPELWEKLGRPNFITINPIKLFCSFMAVIFFLIRKDYEKLEDIKFRRECRKFRKWYPVFYLFVIVSVILFMWWANMMQGLSQI